MATATLNTIGWLINNIGNAVRWRGNTPDGGGCAHDCEGGVDIPLPAGTPIYALATGPLIGSGTFTMGNGAFGHSVITQEVSGTGKVYYQHLDALPSIPQCVNGACNGYTVQAGQLLGYSNADIGEVEVGINPAWGGIWGPPTNGSGWSLDPRAALIALATTGGNVKGQSNPGGNCPDCSQYSPWVPTQAVQWVACVTQQLTCQAASGAGAAGSAASAGAAFFALLGPWLADPLRILKLLGGSFGILIGVWMVFMPERVQQVGNIAMQAAKVVE